MNRGGPPPGAGLALAACLAISAAGSLAIPSPAAAQSRLRWSDDWARVHPASYVVTTSSVALTLLVDRLYEPPPVARLRGPALFDADLRAALAAETDGDREAAATLSDVLLVGLLLWPFVDSIGVTGLGDLNSDVFWQLSNVALEVLAADFVVGSLVKLFVDRQRPHGDRCADGDAARDPGRCGRRGVTRSFYSGHASAAFASAGHLCMSHAHLPLYGGPAGDALGCGAAILTASIVGVLRVVADRHYATDVLVGAVLGLATGLLLPYLLHYGWDPSDDLAGAPAPLAGSAPARLSFGGSF